MNQTPVNVIMPSVGQPQASPNRAPAGQRDMYQSQQTSAATLAARIGNFRSDPSRASAIYQQQQQAQTRSEPAQDQPTSVDPSLAYNRHHEYQQQIKEAEAEAARLAKIEEEKKAGKEAEKRKAEAARLQKEAEYARIAKQKKAEAAKAAREANAAEKKRQKQEAETAAPAAKARAASERAIEAAQTLAENVHHQINFGMNAPQEMQGEREEEYMEVQAGDEQDEDYEGEEQQQSNHPYQQQQRGTPAHKPILPPQCQQRQQQTPQPRAPQQQQEAPANDADLTAMMEEEIRKTVKRLRDFQAKDPKLFLKVWSSVRKSGEPEKPPQHNSEGSQAQQSPAMGNSSMSYGAGPSNHGNAHQNDPTQPPNLLPVPPLIPKKKPGRKLKKSLEAQAQAQAPVQANQNQNHDPPVQNQPPPNLTFRGFADDIPGEVLAPGESIMMQTGNPQQLPRKKNIGRPSNAEKALREMENANLPPQSMRKPGRPKGSKTKPKPVESEQSQDDVPMEAPPAPPMQPPGPGTFGRMIPPPPADPVVREAYNQQIQRNLQASDGRMRSISRMSDVTPASTPNAATSTPHPVQQHAPSGTPQSATTATLEQAKAARIAQATSQTQQNQAAQWPDEHIDLIADTGSKLLNSLPQNAGKTMESKTIRDMLRTNPSYVQVCEMIESKGFHMDRSKFARTLLSIIPPNHPPPPQVQGQQQAVTRAEASNIAQVNTGERGLTSAAAAMRAHKEALTAGRPGFSQTPTPTAPAQAPARPYNTYHPPKYGGVESGTRPVEEGSFVREGTAQSQSGPAKRTAARKGKYTSPYQSLRPEEDDFVPCPMDEDDNERDQYQLSLSQAYNKGYGSYKTPYGAAQDGATSLSAPAQTSVVQTTAQGTYLGTGVWASLGQSSQSTPPRQHPYPYQSQFSSQNNNGPASLQGSRPQPKPWGDRANSSSEVGARAPNPFGATPFRVNSATPQPQMPTPGTQKNVQTLYSTPYLQVNSIEEVSNSYQQQIAKDPLLNFDGIVFGIVLPIDTSVARRRSKYDPKTIARDILISTGRHPSERPLNRHLEPLKDFRAVDNQSDLSTFRWDIVDPGGDEVGSLNKELKERAAAAKMAAGSRRGPVPTRGNPFAISTKPRKPSGVRNETIEIEDDDAIDVDDEGMPPPQSVRASKEGTQTTGRRPGREERNSAPNSRPMPAAELKKLQHDAGRRYREDSEQTPSEAEEKPPVEYVKFACKWEKCGRVLVNLATLRRHIFTMHGQHDDVVTQGKVCMWHGCGNKDYSAENDLTPGTYCDNLKLFREHMEDTHLKSVALLYGDGAKTDVYGMFCFRLFHAIPTSRQTQTPSPLSASTSSVYQETTLTSPQTTIPTTTPPSTPPFSTTAKAAKSPPPSSTNQSRRARDRNSTTKHVSRKAHMRGSAKTESWTSGILSTLNISRLSWMLGRVRVDLERLVLLDSLGLSKNLRRSMVLSWQRRRR